MNRYRKILILIIVSVVFFGVFKKYKKNKIIELPYSLQEISFLDVDGKSSRVVFTELGKTYVYNEKKLDTIDKEIVKRMGDYYLFKKDNKYGLLDLDFNLKLGPHYDRVEEVGVNNLIIVENAKKMKLLSLENKFESLEYDRIKKIEGENGLKVTIDGKQGYIDYSGNPLIEAKYKAIFPFKGKFAIALLDKEYGVINDVGEVVVPFKFNEIYVHKNGNILTAENGNYSIWSRGEIGSFEKLYPSLEDNLVFEKNNRFGILRLKDFHLSKAFFEEIDEVPKDYMIVGENGKYGIYNVDDENKRVDFIYDYILRVDKDIFKAGKLETGLYSIILKNNQKVTDEIYSDVMKISENHILAFREDEIDLYLKNLRKLMSLKRDEIVYFDKNTVVLKNGKVIILEPIN